MSRSVLDLQSDPVTVKRIEEILERLKASNTTEGFLVSLLQNHDELVACVIGIKREIAEIGERLAVVETKVSIANSIGSKIGLLVLGGILTSVMGLAVWAITN